MPAFFENVDSPINDSTVQQWLTESGVPEVLYPLIAQQVTPYLSQIVSGIEPIWISMILKILDDMSEENTMARLQAALGQIATNFVLLPVTSEPPPDDAPMPSVNASFHWEDKIIAQTILVPFDQKLKVTWSGSGQANAVNAKAVGFQMLYNINGTKRYAITPQTAIGKRGYGNYPGTLEGEAVINATAGPYLLVGGATGAASWVDVSVVSESYPGTIHPPGHFNYLWWVAAAGLGIWLFKGSGDQQTNLPRR